MIISSSYVTTKYWYNDNGNTVHHYLERLQFVEPMERQWVVDPLWNAHFEERNQMCVSYNSFTEYLSMIRSIGVDHWRSLQLSDINPHAVNKEQRRVSRWDCGGPDGSGEGAVDFLEIDNSAVTL